MAGEKDRVEGYLATVDRLEPDINPIDASAFYASAAISLKRIADAVAIVVAVPDLAPERCGLVRELRATQLLMKLRENDGECIGDHPDWIAEIDAILKAV